ncbi:MAG TPA: TadE family type IV pilus minor pilin [Rhodoglobus sp.]|nr:TadE family type IV pilus minor pilin [Rhodoglobus sp.]
MRCRFRADDHGSVTAEFAVALPAVILVLAACLTGMQAVGQQLRLADAAAHAARSLARGESADVAAARAAREVPGASITQSADGDLTCVTGSAPAALGLTVTASSCALSGGR